jgi:biopolymer transport protein ExbD
MAMSVGPASSGGEPEAIMDMNTTPLIDVMLVLLIMLIMTIPIQTHAVKLDMPQDSTPPPETVKPEVEDIIIDFDGTVTWNGNVVPTIDKLEEYFQSVTDKVPQPEVHVHPNRLAIYKTVAEVLGAAQRNHMTKLGVVSNERLVD